MRELMNLVEAALPIDRAREEEFANTVDGLLAQARDLERGLKALALAPSVEAQLHHSMQNVREYLDMLSKHAHHNLKR